MILLYLTLCLAGGQECHEFQFQLDIPWTLHECNSRVPIVEAAAISQMNGDYTLRSMRCGAAGDDI